MSSQFIAVWPAVRVFPNGESTIIRRGDEVPDGVSVVELDNLVSFGAIAGVITPDLPIPFDPAPPAPAVTDVDPTVVDADLAATGVQGDVAPVEPTKSTRRRS